jgi:hypothetical protein
MSAKDQAETAAFHYVPAILGVRLEEYDHSGRQGAVDALLHYPDERVAALEVTSAAADGRRQLYSLLNANPTLPNPGSWTWSATIDDPRDFPELLERVERIIVKCEANGVTHPEHAYDLALAGDPDLGWIVRSSVTMWGSPELPKIREEDGVERPLFVHLGGTGGVVDESLSGFAPAVSALLGLSHLQKRLEKLRRTDHTEQHLFVLADDSAFPFEVAYALMTRDVIPPGRPALPSNLTHLWLLLTFSPWILLGTREGWLRYARNEIADATRPRH